MARDIADAVVMEKPEARIERASHAVVEAAAYWGRIGRSRDWDSWIDAVDAELKPLQGSPEGIAKYAEINDARFVEVLKALEEEESEEANASDQTD
jgi:hypothetical protein